MDSILYSTCGKSYDTESKFKKNVGQVHDKRPRACKQCDKVYEGNLQLSVHMKSNKITVCDFCWKEIPKNSASSL